MGRRLRRGTTQRSARGETQSDARKRKRAEAKRNRRALVDYVRARDGGHCRLCGRRVQFTYEAAPDFGEVHEFVFRSKGGSDVEPTNCLLVCKGCHTAEEPCLHPGIGHRAKRVIVALDSDALMEGPVRSDVVPLDADEPPDVEHQRAA